MCCTDVYLLVFYGFPKVLCKETFVSLKVHWNSMQLCKLPWCLLTVWYRFSIWRNPLYVWMLCALIAVGLSVSMCLNLVGYQIWLEYDSVWSYGSYGVPNTIQIYCACINNVYIFFGCQALFLSWKTVFRHNFDFFF